VYAFSGFEKAGDTAQEGPGQAPNQNGYTCVNSRRQRYYLGKEYAYRQGRNAPGNVLAFGAYVKEAGFEGEGHGKARKDDRRGVLHHIHHVSEGAENPGKQGFVGFQRVKSRDKEDYGPRQKADENGQQGVEEHIVPYYTAQALPEEQVFPYNNAGVLAAWFLIW
jgi:hypothetical protein